MYSATSGAETATAGATIASATWNQINSDYRTALSQIGQGITPILAGSKIGVVNTASQVVNFAASISDAGTFTINLPSSVTTYKFNSLRIYNAAGNLNSTGIALFTGAGGTGTTVIASLATTVTSSLPQNANSQQTITSSLGNTTMFNAAQMFLRVVSSVATSSTATAVINYQPND